MHKNASRWKKKAFEAQTSSKEVKNDAIEAQTSIDWILIIVLGLKQAYFKFLFASFIDSRATS